MKKRKLSQEIIYKKALKKILKVAFINAHLFKYDSDYIKSLVGKATIQMDKALIEIGKISNGVLDLDPNDVHSVWLQNDQSKSIEPCNDCPLSNKEIDDIIGGVFDE